MDNNMSSMINKLLSDPESMKKIMEMANSLGLNQSAQAGQQSSQAGQQPAQASGQDGGDSVPAMTGQSQSPGGDGSEALSRAVQALGGLSAAQPGNDKHSALLMALKPYMRSQRQQRLDGAMKLMNAVKIFRNMGGGL